jgi:hypothetical protein
MATGANTNLALKRKSVGFFLSGEAGNASPISSHEYMFIEDIQFNVITGGRSMSSRRDVTIELIPTFPLRDTIIMDAFSTRDKHIDLSNTISRFIEEAAFHLGHRGIAYYEIVKEHLSISKEEEDESEPIEQKEQASIKFKVLYIPGRVVRFGAYYLQIIPRAERARKGKAFVLIPAANVWPLGIPPELGGPRKLRRLLRTLAQSSAPLPKFVLEAMSRLSEIKEFSFTDFDKLKHLAVACESAQWGWPARDIWRDETLEYFRIYRHLRFALTMAILRESILSSMNDLLRQLGFSSSFVLKGLPTPIDIRNCITKLAKGEATFEDALKLIRS